MRCSDCGFEAKSSTGLASHRRAKHRELSSGPNAEAIEETLGELERMGRLEKVDAALVQALRSMAAALDANPFNSQMWREYHEAVKGLCADDHDDAGVEALIRELSTPVRDEA